MRSWSDLENCRIVRLNATLFPVSEFEASLYEKYNLRPLQIEANSREEIIPHVEDCDALFAISVSLPETVVSSLSRCRVISRLGAGTDKIDVAMATRKGILVTNVPYFCVEEQADHTMAMMLALARKLQQDGTGNGRRRVEPLQTTIAKQPAAFNSDIGIDRFRKFGKSGGEAIEGLWLARHCYSSQYECLSPRSRQPRCGDGVP